MIFMIFTAAASFTSHFVVPFFDCEEVALDVVVFSTFFKQTLKYFSAELLVAGGWWQM